MVRVRTTVGVAAAMLLGIPLVLVGAAAPLPTPGTPAQVAALVKASHAINALPTDLVPPLADVGNDNAARYFPATRQGCATTTACVYGDRAATVTVALFGDSHAAMWLPAVNWDGTQLGFRVVVLWRAGCPDADVTVWNASSHSPDTQCNAFRAASLKALDKLAPRLVLVSDRTNDIKGANGKLLTNAEWQAGLERTLTTLLGDRLHVGVIGDVTAMTNMLPQCLSAYPKHIQRCSSPSPNPAMHQHVGAEEAAAKADKVPYVNPQPWVCTTTCSPVVGDLDVYYDSEHLSATYAAYLARDLEAAIKPLLAPAAS